MFHPSALTTSTPSGMHWPNYCLFSPPRSGSSYLDKVRTLSRVEKEIVLAWAMLSPRGVI